MKNCNSGISLDKEFNLRKKHHVLTWAFLLMVIVFIVVGLSVLADSLPAYSIILVTIGWIAIDLIRNSIESKIYRIVAFQKAQEHKMRSDASIC